MKDIDELSLELTEELLEKTYGYDVRIHAKPVGQLPSKVLYRYRKWMRSHRPRSVQEALSLSEIQTPDTLAKNEVMASTFDSGHIKLDFGSEVPEKVKKAALEWAKRKGLKVSEASLAKSAMSPSFVVYAISGEAEMGQITKQIKWSY